MNQELSQKLTSSLAIDKFYYWLKKQPVNRVIGVVGRTCSCPVASYLSNVHTVNRPYVTDDWIMLYALSEEGLIGAQECNIDAPFWVKLFVDKIDKPRIDTPVEAQEALIILWDVIKNMGMKNWDEGMWDIFRDRIFIKSSQLRRLKLYSASKALQNAGRRSNDIQCYLETKNKLYLHKVINTKL